MIVFACQTSPPESASRSPTMAPATSPMTGSHQRVLSRSHAEARSTSRSPSGSGTGAGRLIGRPADERGGVWGTGRFPTFSKEGGCAGETWFPPRPRAEGERCSSRGDPTSGPAPVSLEALLERRARLPAEVGPDPGRVGGGTRCVALAPRSLDDVERARREP